MYAHTFDTLSDIFRRLESDELTLNQLVDAWRGTGKRKLSTNQPPPEFTKVTLSCQLVV
jgi:hypothetical protein